MQTRDFKKTQSSFIHGFRHNMLALHHILETKYHGKIWPSDAVSPTPEGLASAALESINRSSGLWLQTGFLCDLIVLPEQGGDARHYRGLPVDYVRDPSFGQHDHYYTITLEYGPDYPDYPFDFNRFIGPDEAHLNPQLHPIVRCYKGATLIAEQHIMETLEGQWPEHEFGPPLQAFFQRRPSDTYSTADAVLERGVA